MNVLSLFDGISCGQIALRRAGVEYDKYYSFEIDTNAIKVAQSNYSDTIQLGDVNNVGFFTELSCGLLIGGSPCQDISNLSTDKLGLDGKKSSLFFKYVEAKNMLNPKYFLLENVSGNPKSISQISKILGVRPIRLNSNLVSAQNRNRLYWTNIPVTTIPKNKKIIVNDILEKTVDERFYQTPSWVKWFEQRKENLLAKGWIVINPDKAACLTARMYANWKGNFIEDKKGIRRLTPIECERLQTIPDGYTKSVSDNHAYKLLGNCWTIDSVVHILKHIPATPN